MSHSIFGWDLPPGCSMRDIERQFEDAPLDCPVCADGKELDGPECEVKLPCGTCKGTGTINGDECQHCLGAKTLHSYHGVTCKIHGCIVCNNLNPKREYCQGPYCDCNYIRKDQPSFEYDNKKFCSEYCKNTYIQEVNRANEQIDD